MRSARFRNKAALTRRLASVVAAIGIVAALSGCVIYPAGYYGHAHYWHGRDWR